MAKLKVVYKSTKELVPYAMNARVHSEHQVELIARSIEEFGFVNPVLIDGSNTIIAGHGRLMAAARLGMDQVPVIMLDYLSERQRRALVLADNEIASKASWDMEKLSQELSALADDEYDLSVIGFDEQELDAILRDDAGILPEGFGQPSTITIPEHQRRTETVRNGLTDDDKQLQTPQQPTTRRGDVWILGNHRLVCGDSTNPDDVAILMRGEVADMVFTDPPYNVKISGIGSGNENSVISKHGEFVMASGEMSEDEFTEFLRKVFNNMVASSRDGAIHYVCMDWRHMMEVLKASDAYGNIRNGGGGVLAGSQTADRVE